VRRTGPTTNAGSNNELIELPVSKSRFSMAMKLSEFTVGDRILSTEHQRTCTTDYRLSDGIYKTVNGKV